MIKKEDCSVIAGFCALIQMQLAIQIEFPSVMKLGST
jgi:hypothetical protein